MKVFVKTILLFVLMYHIYMLVYIYVRPIYVIATCPQGALATWQAPVRAEFDIPESYKLLCGVSMGYEKKNAKINTFKPNREPVRVVY